MLVLHSSLMLSPDLKIVPEGVAEVMLSLAREPETRHTSSKHSSGPIIALDFKIIRRKVNYVLVGLRDKTASKANVRLVLTQLLSPCVCAMLCVLERGK